MIRQTDQRNRRHVYMRDLEIFPNKRPNQKGRDGLLKDNIVKTDSL